MYENLKIPTKLDKNTIKEAIFDLRFEQKLPEKEIVKIIASYLNCEYETTSIQSLPENVREVDAQLRISPTYRVRKDGFVVGVGLHNLFFDCTENYPSWEKYSKFFFDVITKIIENNEYKAFTVKQFAVRYIDVMDVEINKCCDVQFKFRNELIENTYSFNTQLKENDFLIILNIGTYRESKSLVDVGVFNNVSRVSLGSFQEQQREKVDESHKIAKKYFTGLLRDDFMKTLGPHYEGEE